MVLPIPTNNEVLSEKLGLEPSENKTLDFEGKQNGHVPPNQNYELVPARSTTRHLRGIQVFDTECIYMTAWTRGARRWRYSRRESCSAREIRAFFNYCGGAILYQATGIISLLGRRYFVPGNGHYFIIGEVLFCTR